MPCKIQMLSEMNVSRSLKGKVGVLGKIVLNSINQIPCQAAASATTRSEYVVWSTPCFRDSHSW